MPTVRIWTGAEVRALRMAKRMSLREFAAHLGVSQRMISKWERGRESIEPRPVNQAALDTCLALTDPDAQARFTHLIRDTQAIDTDTDVEPIGDSQVRHPTDGGPMVKVDGSVYLAGPSNQPLWEPCFYIDVHPVSNADYARFLAATDHPPPQHWDDGQPPEHLAHHPVVYVTWHDAAAYAEWASKALPTSQQWEKAARGTRGNVYPWGDQPTPAKCNVRENGVGATTPVDCYQSGVAPTASTTSAATSGNGAPPRPSPAATNSKAAPGPAPSTARHPPPPTTPPPPCATTTPASAASCPQKRWTR